MRYPNHIRITKEKNANNRNEDCFLSPGYNDEIFGWSYYYDDSSGVACPSSNELWSIYTKQVIDHLGGKDNIATPDWFCRLGFFEYARGTLNRAPGVPEIPNPDFWKPFWSIDSKEFPNGWDNLWLPAEVAGKVFNNGIRNFLQSQVPVGTPRSVSKITGFRVGAPSRRVIVKNTAKVYDSRSDMNQNRGALIRGDLLPMGREDNSNALSD
ncbi:hypothetical protein MKZ38_007065 [Zalerion maritima]|uniref:Uncharacterized protein n=1 Tax=Zalerion maritima TaxID=339359 RepID=A0AAD5WQ08_9PEZI|nr:hypothetical protein MKZ38_007065 [Zalerion maritima]